ncbi:MAG: transposase, partial [Kiritimatiellaeota bacterium]|nr:transposase [Kiritimatiellota bacterium]
GKLDPENRWVRLSKLIPWDLLEDLYGSKLSNGMGRPGKNVRVAFGARIIKHKLNLSDEEVVEQIRENPYPQFFNRIRGVPPGAPVRLLSDDDVQKAFQSRGRVRHQRSDRGESQTVDREGSEIIRRRGFG